MSKRRPYVRPMDGWWKKNPFYVEYMVHEGTALFVAAYAITLLVGVIRLGQGEAAWNGWLELKRFELTQATGDRTLPPASGRIEMADLRERVRKLAAIRAGAPEPVYRQVLGLARTCLPEHGWQRLERELGAATA